MSLIQKLKFFRDLAAKVKELDVAGKLDQAADIADQVEQALRYAADLCREYLGVPTVGDEGGEDLPAELAATQEALAEVVGVRAVGATAIDPATIFAVLQVIMSVVELIRKKRGL